MINPIVTRNCVRLIAIVVMNMTKVNIKKKLTTLNNNKAFSGSQEYCQTTPTVT